MLCLVYIPGRPVLFLKAIRGEVDKRENNLKKKKLRNHKNSNKTRFRVLCPLGHTFWWYFYSDHAWEGCIHLGLNQEWNTDLSCECQNLCEDISITKNVGMVAIFRWLSRPPNNFGPFLCFSFPLLESCLQLSIVKPPSWDSETGCWCQGYLHWLQGREMNTRGRQVYVGFAVQR